MMSVSWIRPGRRVLSLVSQRGPLSGGNCIATSGSWCALAELLADADEQDPAAGRAGLGNQFGDPLARLRRPSRGGSAPASTTASPQSLLASLAGSNSGCQLVTVPSVVASAIAAPGPKPQIG